MKIVSDAQGNVVVPALEVDLAQADGNGDYPRTIIKTADPDRYGINIEIISSNRVAQRFALLRGTGRKALVCYVTAGHPDMGQSLSLLRGPRLTALMSSKSVFRSPIQLQMDQSIRPARSRRSQQG